MSRCEPGQAPRQSALTASARDLRVRPQPMRQRWASVERASPIGAVFLAAVLGVACGSSSAGDTGPGHCPAGMTYCGGCDGVAGTCGYGGCAGIICRPPTDGAPPSDAQTQGISLDGPSFFSDSGDAMVVSDGGATDGPSDATAADAAVSCGTAVCSASQVCVQFLCGGGPNRCVPVDDAGGCPSGWRFDPTCPGSAMGGCDPPPCTNPPPFCADTPASCTGAPSCGCVGLAVCGSLSCISVSGRNVTCGAA
jgi:hypothetical protein